MDFGDAIRQMKAGRRICRSGWNGKNMYVYLEAAIETPRKRYEPNMILRTAAGTFQPGWNASTADVLATDWEITTGDL